MKELKKYVSISYIIVIVFLMFPSIIGICFSLSHNILVTWKFLTASIICFVFLSYLFISTFSNSLHYDENQIIFTRLFHKERNISYWQIKKLKKTYRPYRLWIIMKEGHHLWIPYAIFDPKDIAVFIKFTEEKIK